MANGFTDPGAGRYRGEDDAAARAFRELQRNLERLREDPLIKITATTAIVGTYKAIPMGGRTTADGVSAPGNHWGMRTEPVSRAYTVVNTLESPTNSASLIRIGTVLVGSRRMNANGEDAVFVSYTPSSSDYIDTAPDGEGGGPGIIPGGIPPDSTTGGPSGTCPLTKTVTIAGGDAGNGTYTVTWDPTWFENNNLGMWTFGPASAPPPPNGSIHVILYQSNEGGGSPSDTWKVECLVWGTGFTIFRLGFPVGTRPVCPPNGNYPIGTQNFLGGSISCVVSN